MRLPVISPLSFILLFSLPGFAFSGEPISANDDTAIAKSISPIFDWSEELIKVELPGKGYRFADLNDQQLAALRRGFKLSLDALIEADSLEDLSSLITVRPLPDPSEPFLPVEMAALESHDPFGDSKEDSNLGPLDRLFLAEGRLNTDNGDIMPDASSDISDAFSDEDPFADSSADSSNDLSPTDDGDDPFASDSSEDSDPFGDSTSDEDDPFADF